MKTVGIIGGLGPETTSEFYLDLIFSCARQEKITRPGIIIASVPLPYKVEEDLIENNIGCERYIPYLLEEAQRLEQSGADFLVMPCNSLHMFIDNIRESVNIPVLSILEETVKYIKDNNLHYVGIVSTSATIENKLYENIFEENSIDYVTPDDFDQAKMGKFIMNLVTGQQNNRDREQFIEIINKFDGKNVDAVALACTDLQLLIPKHPRLRIFDTMKVLVDATVKEIFKEGTIGNKKY